MSPIQSFILILPFCQVKCSLVLTSLIRIFFKEFAFDTAQRIFCEAKVGSNDMLGKTFPLNCLSLDQPPVTAILSHTFFNSWQLAEKFFLSLWIFADVHTRIDPLDHFIHVMHVVVKPRYHREDVFQYEWWNNRFNLNGFLENNF